MFFRGLLALGVILGATGAPLWAQSPTPPPPPAWWSAGQPLIRSGDADHDNYRPANLGQLKNFADKARLHLNDRLAAVGGAGPAIEDMVTGWPSANPANYAPLNLGQLKAVADKFYARLDAVGFDYKSQLTAAGYPVSRWTVVTGTSHERPWDEAAAPATNYAPANLGQLKVLFSFDLAGYSPAPGPDSDGDGISDAEEALQGTDPNLPDSDWDGVSDRQEQIDGTNPLDPASVTPRRIAHFPFDALDLRSAEGQLPREVAPGFAAAQRVTSFKGRGIRIDQGNQILAYDWVRSDGSPNVALHRGSARMWFKPAWSSTGTNPMTGAYSRLFDLGFYADNAATAQFVLHFNAEQPMIQFYESDGSGHSWSFTPSLAAHPVTAGQWHEVVAVWSPTSRKVYLNGALVAEVTGNWSHPPDVADFTQHGLKFASDGSQPLMGILDEVEFFNYELPAAQIATAYAQAASKLVSTNPHGLPDAWVDRYFPGGLPEDFDPDADAHGMTYAEKAAFDLDPTKESTNDIGIPDGWLVGHGLDPRNADPYSDEDEGIGDGLPLIEEYRAKTSPASRDTDGDNKIDGEDGWALDKDLKPPRLPEPRYAVIDLSESGLPANTFLYKVNDKGMVLADGVWENGQFTSCPSGFGGRNLGNDGYVYGEESLEGYPYSRPAKWKKGGGVVSMWVPGYDRIQLLSASDSGLRVSGVGIVSMYTVPPSNGYISALIWNAPTGGAHSPAVAHGPVEAIPDSAEFVNWMADVINDRGIVAGGGSVGSWEVLEPARVLINGGLQQLPNPAFLGEQDEAGVADINNWEKPVLAAGFYVSDIQMPKYFPGLWVNLPEGGWALKMISEAFDGEGSINALNDRLEIVGDSSAGWFPTIWINGQERDPADFISGWKVSGLYDINNHGLITASAKKLDENGATSGEDLPVMLLPCDIVPDFNRDGIIDNKDRGKVTKDNPWRWWCNDDDDSNNQENPTTGLKDSRDYQIQSLRDLEDFARLQIYLGGLQDAIANGTIQVGLEWRNVEPVNGSSPSINVYQAAEPDGGEEYIKNTDGQETWANRQFSGQFKTALGGQSITSGNTSFRFPSWFWQSTSYGLPAFDADHSNRYLLFEGVTEGKGQLVLTFWKGSTPIGEGGGVWLDIKNIKRMYVREEGYFTSYDSPFQQHPQGVSAANRDFDNITFEAPIGEEDKAIIFVHGIHGPGLDEADKIRKGWYATSETVFKRLWHQGFKGRFLSYKWPALTPGPQGWPPDYAPFAFNESEYRAWKIGQKLAEFIKNVPRTRKSLMAHSQGNVVCGYALSYGGATVENYALMQAAVPAGCYDASGGVNNYQLFTSAESQVGPTPDYTSDLGYREYLASLNVTRRVINFHNKDDFALVRGHLLWISTSWEGNERDYKPNAPSYKYLTTYSNMSPRSEGERCWWGGFGVGGASGWVPLRNVSDIMESMAFVARPRSQAAGALGSTRGLITGEVNLNGAPFNFTDVDSDHGGQFDRPIQEAWDVYESLKEIFGDE